MVATTLANATPPPVIGYYSSSKHQQMQPPQQHVPTETKEHVHIIYHADATEGTGHQDSLSSSPLKVLELGLEFEDDDEQLLRPSSPTSVSECNTCTCTAEDFDENFSSSSSMMSSWNCDCKRERECSCDSDNSSSTKGVRVTFPAEPVSEIRTRPRTEGEERAALFYSPEDLRQFREDYRAILRAARGTKRRGNGSLILSSSLGCLSDFFATASTYVHQVIVAGGECKDTSVLVDTLYLF